MNGNDREPTPQELFERFFGPTIFVPWTEILLGKAEPRPGERVLDLACATGTVARHVAPAVGPEGTVVGLDLDPGMLAVARETSASEGARVEWREGDAMDLDLPDEAFDLVLCQQGLQFFPDPLAALREAKRVLVDGGRIALSVWQPLERHPVYAALLGAEARHLSEDLAEVATPFMFGDDDRLRFLMRKAGFDGVEVVEETLEVAFPDPDTFVALTVMAGAAVIPAFAQGEPEERRRLIEAVARECEAVLREHRDGDVLRFPMPNYVGTAYA